MNEDLLKTGTTTIGIVCKDGVVIAADKRSTAGGMVANKKQLKLVQIADNMVVAYAGLVSDAQLTARLIRAEIKLKDVQTGRLTTVKEAANLLAGMLYSLIRRPSMVPGVVAVLLVGSDAHNGHQLYNIGIDGSLTPKDDFDSEGSGSVFALGVLESQYKKNLGVDEGIELAVKSVNAALQRDIASGNGCDVWVVNEHGVKKVVQKEVDTGVRL